MSVWLLTFTVVAAWPTFPAASDAFTVRIWLPFAASELFQLKENGDEEVVPVSVPSTKSWIFTTPTLSVALP